MPEKSKIRGFIAVPRCLYSGVTLDASHAQNRPSPEHIIPLSLGGSNAFVTTDVSLSANNLAGNQIDDAVSSLFAVALLRNKYKLAGHRGKVPDVRLEGTFLDMASHPSASMVVDGDGSVNFEVLGTTTSTGKSIQITGSEDWVSTMLGHRLRQAQHHGGYLSTPLGDIKDAEDIRVAVAVAASEAGREFKSELVLDLRAHQRALQHFAIKVALCVGHRTLGPTWTFGPDGNLLRSSLFPVGEKFKSSVRGSLYADVKGPLEDMLDLSPDRHSIAFMRFGEIAIALIALFGGELGIAAVGLSRRAKKYRSGKSRMEPEGHLFLLDRLTGGKPAFLSRSLDQMLLTVSPFF